jgi:hypothetical protein
MYPDERVVSEGRIILIYLKKNMGNFRKSGNQSVLCVIILSIKE